MGYRQYLCVPHRETRPCASERDFPGGNSSTVLDVIEGAGALAHLITVLGDLEADSFARPETVRTITTDIRAFEAIEQVARATDEVARLSVPYDPWLEAFVDLARIVREPPWALRKKLKQGTGPLVAFAYVDQIADKLARHRTCSDFLHLDGHR